MQQKHDHTWTVLKKLIIQTIPGPHKNVGSAKPPMKEKDTERTIRICSPVVCTNACLFKSL